MWAFFFSALWDTGGALIENNPQQLPHNIDIQCALNPLRRHSKIKFVFLMSARNKLDISLLPSDLLEVTL